MSNNKKSNIEDKDALVVTPAVKDKSAENKDEIKSSSQAKNNVDKNKVESRKVNKNSSKSSSGNGLNLMLLLFVVIATGAASAYFWQIQQKQNQFIEQQARSLDSLQSNVEKLSKNVETGSKLNTVHTQNIQKLTDQIVQAEIVSQRAIEIVNRSKRDWALSEIDYLLRIAHRRVEVARDVGGAIAALKGADSRINELGDLNLFKVRKQLAVDIANLNAIHQADVNGISLAIDGMIVYLSDLPFKSVKDEIKVQLDNENTEKPVIEEQTFVDSVLETVKKIGDIKVHQRSIEAASSLQQQNQIEQLLRTYLLSSRLAALQFNQAQFLREVQQANQILHMHYDIKDNRVQQLQKTLNDFSALQLSPDLPELTKAWTLLQSEINKTAVKKSKSVNKAEAKKQVIKSEPVKKSANKVEKNKTETAVKMMQENEI